MIAAVAHAVPIVRCMYPLPFFIRAGRRITARAGYAAADGAAVEAVKAL